MKIGEWEISHQLLDNLKITERGIKGHYLTFLLIQKSHVLLL